ncbi:unknown [Prevotella sp. CAG:924]|nr:unknown [Prevotella sp. CAG:924]
MKWPYGDLHLFISLKKAIKLDLSRKMHSKNGSVSLSVPETSLLWE